MHDRPQRHLTIILSNEIRELMPVGLLQLQTTEVRPMAAIRGNVKKVHLERAVVTKLPPTERLIFLMHDVESYDHQRLPDAGHF